MSLLDVDTVAKYLNITVSITDGKLQGVLDAAELAVARHIGLDDLAPHVVTERVPGGTDALVLTKTPVVAVQTIAGAGSSLDPTALVVGSRSGLVTYPVTGRTFGHGEYVVTYQAGFVAVGETPLPPDVTMAVEEMVRHLWRDQRGAGSRGQETEVRPLGYLVPNIVASLLKDYVIPLGFA